jgi:hypothetical protein
VRSPGLLVAALLTALLLAGCGERKPSDEQLVARTVNEFARAIAAKHYRTLCEKLLSPKLIEDVEQVGLPCEQALARALGDVREPRLNVGKITIRGDQATVEIRTSASGQAPSRDTLRLERVGGAWRIASLGEAS